MGHLKLQDSEDPRRLVGRQGIRLSEGRADAEQEVHPGHAGARKRGCAAGDPESEPRPCSGLIVAVRRRERPGHPADDHHEHRDDEHERQQRSDDVFQL